MPKPVALEPKRRPAALTAHAACACGEVRLEIDVPAVWAWHDHSAQSRRAQGCAYVTWVGSWRSRLRIMAGEDRLGRWEDPASGDVRSFCAGCGTPVFLQRPRAPKMVNIPRALFESGVGREAIYHLHIDQSPPWAYREEPLGPLKGYPGVLRQRPRRRRSIRPDIL